MFLSHPVMIFNDASHVHQEHSPAQHPLGKGIVTWQVFDVVPCVARLVRQLCTHW